MVQVLCIDASQGGLRAVVCERSGLNLSVLAAAEHPGSKELLGFEEWWRAYEKQAEEGAPPLPDFSKELRKATEALGNSWEEAVFILPVGDSLSLHLDLPFDNPRSIDRVSRLAAQDRVAFNLEEFHLQARSSGKLESGKNDVRVSLIARQYLQWILDQCSAAGIDPGVIVDPASLLSGLASLEEAEISSSQGVLLRFPGHLMLTFLIDGQVRTRNIIPLVHSNGSSSLTADTLRILSSRINLALKGFEHRYGEPCRDLMVVEDESLVGALSGELNTPIRLLETEKLLHSCPASHSLACLGAMSASDAAPPSGNFRSGPFRPRLPVDRVLTGLRRLLFPAAVALAVTIFGLFLWLQIREYRIARLETALQEQVGAIIPGADLSNERTVTAVQREMGELRKQLDEVGSASRLSPVNSLLNLLEQLRKFPDFSLQRINIVGKRVTIDGQAKNYAQIDRMKNSFQKQSDVYCGEPQDEARPRGSFVSVELTLFLCE